MLVQPLLPNALGLDAADVARRGRDGEGRSEDGSRDSHGDFFVPNLCINLCADTPTNLLFYLSLFVRLDSSPALLSASLVRASNAAMLNSLRTFGKLQIQRIKNNMQSAASRLEVAKWLSCKTNDGTASVATQRFALQARDLLLR